MNKTNQISEVLMPNVSVILPTYNRRELLRKTIDSVFAQTYRDWELIVWDDGSADDTAGMVASLGDPRVRYYRHENRGQAFARNQCCERARGQYLAFLDDDDIWLPNKLELTIEILEKNADVDLLFTDFINIDEQTGRISQSFEADARILNELQTEVCGSSACLITGGIFEAISRKNFILPSTVALRKKVWQEVGPMNETLRGTEDLEYWWRCGLEGVQFAMYSDPTVRRRKGIDSFSSSGEQGLLLTVRAMEICIEHSQAARRLDLVPKLRRSIGVALEQIIRGYGLQGCRSQAMAFFFQRCRYGISIRGVALAVCAVMGPRVFRKFAAMASRAQSNDE